MISWEKSWFHGKKHGFMDISMNVFRKGRAVMMFKVARNLVPSYTSNSFTPLVKSYSTSGVTTRGRSHGNFATTESAPKTDWGKRRLASHGVYLWNGLSTDVKTIEKLFKFKMAVNNLSKSGFTFYNIKFDGA